MLPFVKEDCRARPSLSHHPPPSPKNLCTRTQIVQASGRANVFSMHVTDDNSGPCGARHIPNSSPALQPYYWYGWSSCCSLYSTAASVVSLAQHCHHLPQVIRKLCNTDAIQNNVKSCLALPSCGGFTGLSLPPLLVLRRKLQLHYRLLGSLPPGTPGHNILVGTLYIYLSTASLTNAWSRV